MFFLPDDEDAAAWRPKPERQYCWPGTVLICSAQGLQVVTGVLQQYRRVEAGCFLYGSRDDAGSGLLRAVVVPCQINRRGNYRVPGPSVSAMAKATRPHGWLCLAQIHSHPGAMVEHSCYDDEVASSQNILSIVFPHYGRWHETWPAGVGVHEWQDGYWHLLSEVDASRRVRIESDSAVTLIDLRT